jgi:hypothetical protein
LLEYLIINKLLGDRKHVLFILIFKEPDTLTFVKLACKKYF